MDNMKKTQAQSLKWSPHVSYAAYVSSHIQVNQTIHMKMLFPYLKSRLHYN